MAINITYENLYEILRREKYNPELQKLDEDFFKNVVNYLKEKREILKSHHEKESIFSSVEIQKTKKQIENVERILKELYERRESKIVQLALLSSRANISNVPEMLQEEADFYKKLMKDFNFFRKGILSNLILAKLPKVIEEEKPKSIKKELNERNKLIKVLEPIPKFLDSNLNVYGPLEKEDLVNLPENVANILIKNKRAEEVS